MRNRLNTLKRAVVETDIAKPITIDLNTVTLNYFLTEILPTLKRLTLTKPLIEHATRVRSEYVRFILTYASPEAKPMWRWDQPDNRCPLVPVTYTNTTIDVADLNIQEVLGLFKFNIGEKVQPIYDLVLRCKRKDPTPFTLPCFWQAYHANPELDPADRALKEYVSTKNVIIGDEYLVSIHLGNILLLGTRHDGTMVKFSINTQVTA
jgi:hypothetical protein